MATEAARTTIYLIRHGETDWNASGKLQGQTDVPLNDRGREQAAAVARYMAENFSLSKSARTPAADLSDCRPVTVCYSSPLSRALDTAAAIATACGLDITTDDRLKESHLGAWQGMTWAAAESRYGREISTWKRDPDADVCGAESERARFHRASACIAEIVLRHPGQGVVVVAHGGMLEQLGRLWKAVPFGRPTKLKKVNTSICIADFTPHEHVYAELMREEGRVGDIVAHVAAAHPRHSIRPETASQAVGVWALRQWGITAHMRVEGDAGEDAAADAAGAAPAGAVGAAANDAESEAVSFGV